MMAGTITINVVFSGGLELLFGNERQHAISIPLLVPSDNSTRSTPSSSSSSPTPPLDNGAPPTRAEGTKTADLEYLIHHLRDHLLKERPELFVENGTVRPGILVLINDTDWELEGEGSYHLRDNDEIVFISTLHGG